MGCHNKKMHTGRFNCSFSLSSRGVKSKIRIFINLAFFVFSPCAWPSHDCPQALHSHLLMREPYDQIHILDILGLVDFTAIYFCFSPRLYCLVTIVFKNKIITARLDQHFIMYNEHQEDGILFLNFHPLKYFVNN